MNQRPLKQTTNTVLSSTTESAPFFDDESRSELRERAIGMLARREHSKDELAAKLRQRGYNDSQIEPVLGELAAQGLQSDERFAEQYVRARRSRGEGPVKIQAALQARGVDRALAEPWLKEVPADYLERAEAERRKRFGGAKLASRQERARQARFLARRGFTQDQIVNCLRHAGDAQDEEA